MAKMNEQIGTDEIFSKMKVGDKLKNKRTFRAMKDAGVINDYNVNCCVKPYSLYVEKDGIVKECFAYFGRKPKAGERGSREVPCTEQEWKERSGIVVFHGYRFVISPFTAGSFEMELTLLGKVKEEVAMAV